MNDFELKIVRQHWIKDDDTYDEHDLCSHGEIFLKIGVEELSSKESGSWCLSAAGLFLLRTIGKDYNIGDFDNFLIPCCGHIMFYDFDTKRLNVLGCNSGIDFRVKHLKDKVQLTTEQKIKTIIPFEVYKTDVLKFIAEVEKFYDKPDNKNVPQEDVYLKQGFQKFWQEWDDLKTKANLF